MDSNLYKLALGRITAQLTNIGAKFKIIMPDGTEAGELEVKKISRSSGIRANPGTYSTIYRPLVGGMKPGDVVVVPSNGNLEGMRSALTGHLNHLFGTGAYITSVNREKDQVEVLRLE